MKDFPLLIASIEQVHNHLQARAVNAVNQALTVRNLLIGFHLVEYEQQGADRAEYGSELLNKVAKSIQIKGLTSPELSRCRQFYHSYPQILGAVTQRFNSLVPGSILGSLTQKFEDNLSAERKNLEVPPDKLLTRLSFTQLIKIDDPLKRIFYEIECIKGIWSVRELKRQIASLYYERSGLSAKPEKLAEMAHQKTKPQSPPDIIKNIYAFEFLGLRAQEVVEESDLETALLDHLQEFILELGNGFCMEARQKRILIGETYYFIDLVFYHRILKCHVLIDLKIGAFEHSDIGQLNTYLNFYKENILEKTDNLPVGMLLVAEKDHALIKYATAGMDENLFVQQYLVKLLAKEKLQEYLDNELKKLR
jgi:predicted nuclease of restriction endonuclease-like (RecB) superfamily